MSVSDIGGNEEVIAILQNPSVFSLLFLRWNFPHFSISSGDSTAIKVEDEHQLRPWNSIFKICMRLHAHSLTETKIACWELRIAEIASTFRSNSSQDIVAYRIDAEKFVIPFNHSTSKVFPVAGTRFMGEWWWHVARIHQFWGVVLCNFFCSSNWNIITAPLRFSGDNSGDSLAIKLFIMRMGMTHNLFVAFALAIKSSCSWQNSVENIRKENYVTFNGNSVLIVI